MKKIKSIALLLISALLFYVFISAQIFDSNEKRIESLRERVKEISFTVKEIDCENKRGADILKLRAFEYPEIEFITYVGQRLSCEDAFKLIAPEMRVQALSDPLRKELFSIKVADKTLISPEGFLDKRRQTNTYAEWLIFIVALVSLFFGIRSLKK